MFCPFISKHIDVAYIRSVTYCSLSVTDKHTNASTIVKRRLALREDKRQNKKTHTKTHTWSGNCPNTNKIEKTNVHKSKDRHRIRVTVKIRVRDRLRLELDLH